MGGDAHIWYNNTGGIILLAILIDRTPTNGYVHVPKVLSFSGLSPEEYAVDASCNADYRYDDIPRDDAPVSYLEWLLDVEYGTYQYCKQNQADDYKAAGQD